MYSKAVIICEKKSSILLRQMCEITGRGRGVGPSVRKCESGCENPPKKCEIIFEQPLMRCKGDHQPRVDLEVLEERQGHCCCINVWDR